MCKFLSLFLFFPFICSAEMNGNLEICTTGMENYRIEDGKLFKLFTTIGPEIKGEMYFTQINKLRIEPKILYMWGNRASIEEENLCIGYQFNPKQNFIIKPYIGISNKNLIKFSDIKLYEYCEFLNCKIKIKSLTGVIGSNFILYLNEKVRLKLDFSGGYGAYSELLKIPRELYEFIPKKINLEAGYADLNLEINYKLNTGTYFMAKIGSRVMINKYKFGYGSNYLSLGYRFRF